MADKDGRDDEINALLEIEGVDTAKIAEQISSKRGGESAPPPTVKSEEKPPEEKAEEKKAEEKKPEVPDPEALVAGRLKEIFGDQFASVDELKKADIPAKLKEIESLRQAKQDLEAQLAKKPKHAFASDDIAKFNEFARETGIKDAGVFNRLNESDIANMNAMDALILERIVDDPTLAGKEQQVRRTLERRFNVDPKKVESGDLTQEELDDNLLDVSSEGRKARVKLQGLKAKIKMPEIPAEEPPAGKKKWTPEVEAKQKADWTKVSEKMGAEFAKIPILMKGSKEPIVDFVLPEETRKALTKNAIDYVVNNQLEINEPNVRGIAMQMYSDAILPNLDEIAHAIFERARSMTEEEYLKLYSNPSERNKDNPPAAEGPLTDEEKYDKAFDAELNAK